MSFLDIVKGDSPVVLGLPHTGTEIPDRFLDPLNDIGRAIADTDWHSGAHLCHGRVVGLQTVSVK